MSSPLKLDRILSDAHAAEFDALVTRRGTTGVEARRWLAERGYHVAQQAVYAYIRRRRPDPNPKRMPLKIDRLPLTRAQRSHYEKMVADPGVTIKELQQYLRSLGHEVSVHAIWGHRQRWLPDLVEVKQSAKFSVTLAEVADETPDGSFGRGSVLGLDQLILEQVFRLRKQEQVSAQALGEMVESLQRALEFRKQVAALVRRSGGAPAASKPKGAPATPFNGVEIANCVRRILGVPLPDEPMPDPQPPVEPHAPLLPLPPGGEGGGEGENVRDRSA